MGERVEALQRLKYVIWAILREYGPLTTQDIVNMFPQLSMRHNATVITKEHTTHDEKEIS